MKILNEFIIFKNQPKYQKIRFIHGCVVFFSFIDFVITLFFFDKFYGQIIVEFFFHVFFFRGDGLTIRLYPFKLCRVFNV